MKKRISIIIFIALVIIDGIISFFAKRPGAILDVSTISIAILSLVQFVIFKKKSSLIPTLVAIILFSLVFILLPALTQGDVRYRFAAGIILYAVAGYILYNYRAISLHLPDTCILVGPVLCIMAVPVIILSPDFIFIWMTLSPIIGLALAYVLYKVRQKVLGFSLAIILVAVILVSYLTFIDNSHGAHYNNSGDKKYTSLKFINESGDSLTLNDIHKKVIVLDFWYNGCFYCALGFPKVDALQYKYKNDSDVYIASMQYFINNNTDTFNGFFYLHKYSFNKYNLDSLTQKAWDVHAFPTTLVFDKNKNLRYKGELIMNDPISKKRYRQNHSRFETGVNILPAPGNSRNHFLKKYWAIFVLK